MNSYLKELTKLLVDQVLVEYDAKPDAPLGRWLFGPDQVDKMAKKEPNTPKEQQLKDLFYQHYHNKPSPELGKTLLGLKPEIEKGNYAKYLKPPSGLVYRGIDMSIETLSKIVGISKKELVAAEIGQAHCLKQKGILVPVGGKTKTMSWSRNERQGILFAVNADKQAVSVVFVARTTNEGNEFFVNPAKTINTYEKGPLVFDLDEQEVISVGPVQFDKCVYYIVPYRYYSRKEFNAIGGKVPCNKWDSFAHALGLGPAPEQF